jgi:hypothetical protein
MWIAYPATASTYKSGKCLLKKVGEPKGDAGDLFRVLQLLPDSLNHPLHSGNGKRYY